MSDKKKVIVMCEGTSFNVNAVVRSLNQKNYDTYMIHPIEEEFLDGHKSADAMVIFLGFYVGNPDFMSFISKFIESCQIKVILIGDDSTLQNAEGYFPRGYVYGKFVKPFALSAVIDAVDHIFNGNSVEVRKNILLVDDDLVFLKMVEGWLSDTYNVVPVNTGTQALQFLANHKPDLILLDYEMPVLNGPQVLESIRSEQNLKDIPVFFLTGVDEKSMVTKAIALKPNGYLLKSYDRQKILSYVGNFFKKQAR